ncbi:hypothetical protein DZG00_08265, partial [Clavibacter lycopersici]
MRTRAGADVGVPVMMPFAGRWIGGRPVYEALDPRGPGHGDTEHDGRRPEATAVGARSPSSAGSVLRGRSGLGRGRGLRRSRGRFRCGG